MLWGGNAAENRKWLAEGGRLNVLVFCLGGQAGTGEGIKGVPALISRQNRRSRFVILEDCGHFVMEEQPEMCAQAVLNFVDGGVASDDHLCPWCTLRRDMAL